MLILCWLGDSISFVSGCKICQNYSKAPQWTNVPRNQRQHLKRWSFWLWQIPQQAPQPRTLNLFNIKGDTTTTKYNILQGIFILHTQAYNCAIVCFIFNATSQTKGGHVFSMQAFDEGQAHLSITLVMLHLLNVHQNKSFFQLNVHLGWRWSHLHGSRRHNAIRSSSQMLTSWKEYEW